MLNDCFRFDDIECWRRFVRLEPLFLFIIYMLQEMCISWSGTKGFGVLELGNE